MPLDRRLGRPDGTAPLIIPHLALDAESTDALKQPAGAPADPDTGQPCLAFEAASSR